jgi:DNA-binding MarR family transcriptional regulator
VRLTKKGEEAAKVIFQQHSEWISGLFADISEEESRLLTELLSRIWRRTEAGEKEETTSKGAPW